MNNTTDSRICQQATDSESSLSIISPGALPHGLSLASQSSGTAMRLLVKRRISDRKPIDVISSSTGELLDDDRAEEIASAWEVSGWVPAYEAEREASREKLLAMPAVNPASLPVAYEGRRIRRRDECRYWDPRPADDEAMLRTTPDKQAVVAVFARDVIVKRIDRTHEHAGKRGGGRRGEIVRLSPASRRRLMHYAHNAEGLEHIITVTYPEVETDGRMVKAHLAALRKWLVRRGVGGIWFLEFQERDAPHFHVLANASVDPDELRLAWARIIGLERCPHCRLHVVKEWIQRIQGGDGIRLLVKCREKCQWSKSINSGTEQSRLYHPHASYAYAAKESAKAAQKDVPELYRSVGRMWGLFGGLRVRPRWVIHGYLSRVAPVIRIVRRLNERLRERLGLQRHPEKGRYGFTAWDVGPAVLKVSDRILWNGDVVHVAGAGVRP